MEPAFARRTVATSQEELDAKLQVLQQLCLPELDLLRASDASLKDQSSYLDLSTDQWVQAEYKWALEEASDSVTSLHGFDPGERVVFSGSHGMLMSSRRRPRRMQSLRVRSDAVLPTPLPIKHFITKPQASSPRVQRGESEHPRVRHFISFRCAG